MCKRWRVPRPRPRQPSGMDSAAPHSRRARAPRSRASALLPFGVLVGGGAQRRATDSPGAFLKLWRWRHCLIVSRVAAPAGLWWSAACAGGPPRHGCATRPRPETGELALVAHRTSRIACAMGWACPRSLAGGRDSRRRFRLVWPSLFEEDLFVWPFRLPLDTNVLTYSGAIVLAITLKPYTA